MMQFMRKAIPLLALLFFAAGVVAAPPASQPEDWSQTLRELGAKEPPVRAAAKLRLMGLPFDQLGALKSHVSEMKPLTPAQAEALQDVVIYVYTRGEIGKNAVGSRGFLGVSFLAYDEFELIDRPSPEPPPGLLTGASFTGRLPGFVAYRYLADGDVILSIASRAGEYATPDRHQLMEIIRSLRGGEMVTLRVLRGPTIVELSFPLDHAAPPDQQQMTTAFTADTALQAARNYWYEQFRPLVEADDI